MKNIIRAEIYKLRRSWTTWIGLLVVLVFPFIALGMTSLTNHKALEGETQMLLLLRQNHIFFSMLIGNLLFVMIGAHIFSKEFQFNVLADIIAVPVNRVKLFWAKEVVLLVWYISLGIISFLLCLAIGFLFQLEGLEWSLMTFSFWRYLVSALISFVPIQIILWITIQFRNYFIALAVAVMALVGEIVAFNTTDFIFYYPFSINFVLTNFVENISASEGLSSLIVLIGVLAVFIPAGMLRFKKMDI
jgi:bacitracin transport system permease protein